MLSDEQMAAVHAGEKDAGWTPFDLPTGRQDIPAWCIGLAVNWYYGYGNSPTVTLKVRGDAHKWQEGWSKEGSKTYITRSKDGRAKVYYHDGPVASRWAWRVFKADGKPHTYKWQVVDSGKSGETTEQAARRQGEEKLMEITQFFSEHPTMVASERVALPLRLDVREMRFSSEQGGFGGDHYEMTMVDGTQLILRGPWHGGAPAGYVEVHTCNWDEQSNEALVKRYPGACKRYVRSDLDRPWHKRSCTYGLYITEQLFLQLLSQFAPHVGVARVTKPYGERLELFRPAWGASKSAIYDQELERIRRDEPAGRWWRMAHDARGGYCGTLRRPTNGFELQESADEFERCLKGECRNG